MEKEGAKKSKKQAPINQFKTDKEIAMDFAERVQKKFDRIVKASVLFGSQARNEASASSDVDIILIIDDASIRWDLELVAWYREELGKVIKEIDYRKELHINTIKLTTFWQDLMMGDPVVINILRYGEALIDYGGFFNPIKTLLLQGKIHSTPEAVYICLERAPIHLARSKASVLSSIEGVYWCIIDAAQACLMTAGKIPPSPEHIPKLLDETFVSRKVLKSSYVNMVSDIYSLHKKISHGEIGHIPGSDIEKWHSAAESFLSEMTRIINDIIDSKV
jgi:predicted nucleotidyltransferase/uncharacterized protein (UPF0332 family)